ncbi:hypothetical protein [Streptomyces malaysiensis]|nr:hypothetical protein [Streptomyces autolyticus]
MFSSLQVWLEIAQIALHLLAWILMLALAGTGRRTPRLARR